MPQCEQIVAPGTWHLELAACELAALHLVPAVSGLKEGAGAFGRRVSFLAEGVKRDSEEAHLLKTVASGGPWHSEEQGEEALLTRFLPWAKSPPK